MAFLQIKGQLARLLATENLIVEHDPKAKTASFNVQTRVLVLPVVENASEFVTNMFIGHEVGHALWTPQNWVEQRIGKTPKDFINVIEDVRIEKMIQDKYPGIRKDFSKAYSELNDSDFFGISNKKLTKLSLIDRINVHFKIGAHLMVPFSAKESYFVTAIYNCTTFQEVCKIAHELYEYLKQRGENFEDELVQKVVIQFGGDGDDDGSGEEIEVEIDTDSSGNGSSEGKEGNEDGEEGKVNGSSEGSNEEEGGEENSGNGSGDGEEEDEGGEDEDGSSGGGNSDDDELNDSSSNQSNSDDTGDGSSLSTGNGEIPKEEETSETQKNFDEALEKIMSNSKVGYVYINAPSYIVNDNVTSIKSTRKNIVDNNGDIEREFKAFMNSIRGDVSHMVNQFDMKKKADQYSKQEVRKTGVLDTRVLHQYKLTDDVFKRNTVLPEGKNHGMIMLLDFSGSMSSILRQTIEQILVLVEFCRKVNIPFEVYTFTSGGRCGTKGGDVPLNKCNIVNIISSSAKSNVLREDMKRIHALGRGKITISGLTMNGTPLNNTLFLVPDMIRKMRKETNAQRISFVCITDGQSEPLQTTQQVRSYFDIGSNKIMIRQKNGSVFDLGLYQNETGRIAKWISEVCPETSVTNIFLGTLSSSAEYCRTNTHEFDSTQFTKNSCSYSHSEDSWPTICCVDPSCFPKPGSINLDKFVSKSGLEEGIKEFSEKKKSIRLILSTIVDTFA